MPARLFAAAAVSSTLAILPLAWNTWMLASAQPWIVLAIGIAASILQPSYNPFTISAVRGDRGTGAQIIWSVYCTQLAAVLEAGYLRYPRSVEWDFVAVAALAAAVLGLAFRTWAVFSLGAFFTMHITVDGNQRLVRNGPYSFVRHPSYLGAFFLYMGTILFLHSWLSAAAAAVILPLAFVRRILVEEDMLAKKFGAEYSSYRAVTKRLFPWIW